VDRWDWSVANLIVLVAAALAFLCMEAMALWHRLHLARLAAAQPVERAVSG
jgi:hypothetical protein